MSSWYAEESARVGILEARDDTFAQDLALCLGDAEFITFSEESAAPSRRYKVILDRASYSYPYLREMLKVLALDGCYVMNNPFAASVMNKLIDLRLCHYLGIPVPRTLVLPDMAVRGELPDSVAEPSWEKISQEIGFPCIMKPFDGYGWTDVFVVHDLEQLKGLYASSDPRHIFLVQQLIQYVSYYPVFCVGKREVFFTSWVPRPLGAGEYTLCDHGHIQHVEDNLRRMTIELNACLDMDINALEWCLDGDRRPWLIDAFNEVPDIQKQHLPAECYWWLVENVASLIQEKLKDPGSCNRSFFYLPRAIADWRESAQNVSSYPPA